jgi:hypothetical protein
MQSVSITISDECGDVMNDCATTALSHGDSSLLEVLSEGTGYTISGTL